MRGSMKDVMVVSHHRSGAKTPLASFWFSWDACATRGIRLWFVWARSKKLGLRAFLHSRLIVFDGIYCLAVGYASLIYKLGRLFGKRIAIYWHETEWHAERAMQHAIVKRVMGDKRIRHFHVCTAGMKMLVEQYGVAKDRVYVLNNIAYDRCFLEEVCPLNRMPKWFAACGDVYERKGPDLFIEIARRVCNVHPEARFFWLGSFRPDGYSRQTLDEKIQAANLAQNVFFLGNVSNPAYLMSRIRCVLLTSRDDPMPKILMEALALGQEIVAFDVGGVRELLGGLGTLVPPGDEEAFAEALIAAIDHEWSEDQQEACRRRYRQLFSPPAFAERFQQAVAWWEAGETQ